MTNYLKYKLTVSPMKRHKVAEWIFFLLFSKEMPICCLQQTHFRSKDTWAGSEGMEKDIPCR